MFEKILVANRGEIAVRIIRACKELNIRTVAVYSEADANSMHAQMADEAICIGGAASNESYLRIDRIIGAAEITNVDAIHPGYGFLSENAGFRNACEEAGITFIGPSDNSMFLLGDKIASTIIAQSATVPCVSWSGSGVTVEADGKHVRAPVDSPSRRLGMLVWLGVPFKASKFGIISPSRRTSRFSKGCSRPGAAT